MKTIFTTILTLLFISSVSLAQDILYNYKRGALVSMRAMADINSITFYKPGNMVTDIEGNVYKTVKIGSQTWMAENLKTRQFNDGAPISLVTDNAEWSSLITPGYSGYCWFNNDSATYYTTYGALYNWNTVNTGKLCPTGWHVPTGTEWTILTDYLGGEKIAGGKLKEAGFAHWNDPNQDATNETGFTALPGGLRYFNGTFGFIGEYSFWWSSTEYYTYYAWFRNMNFYTSDVSRSIHYYKLYGFSVRCVSSNKNEF
jgi:uncharacterized protein (TIGR02145 family)